MKLHRGPYGVVGDVLPSRLSEGPEVDPEIVAWRSRSQSEELLPVTESSPSTDSSIIEGIITSSSTLATWTATHPGSATAFPAQVTPTDWTNCTVDCFRKHWFIGAGGGVLNYPASGLWLETGLCAQCTKLAMRRQCVVLWLFVVEHFIPRYCLILTNAWKMCYPLNELSSNLWRSGEILSSIHTSDNLINITAVCGLFWCTSQFSVSALRSILPEELFSSQKQTGVIFCVFRCCGCLIKKWLPGGSARLRGGVLEPCCGPQVLQEARETCCEKTGCDLWCVLQPYQTGTKSPLWTNNIVFRPLT